VQPSAQQLRRRRRRSQGHPPLSVLGVFRQLYPVKSNQFGWKSRVTCVTLSLYRTPAAVGAAATKKKKKKPRSPPTFCLRGVSTTLPG
jgi:hypothetical protein